MKKYFQVPWVSKDLIIIIFTTIGLMLAVIIGMDLSGAAEYVKTSPHKVLLMMGLFLSQSLILLLPLLFVTRKKHGLKLEQFGLEKMKIKKVVSETLKGYFLYLLISYFILVFIIFTNIKIPGYQLPKSIFEIFGTSDLELILTGTIVILIAPIVEEVFFRGFLLRAVADRIGLIWGSIITAAIFAVFHLQWQTVIPVFILGLIINQLVIRNKSIWPAIGFHVINNAIAFLVQILIIKDVIQIEKII